jgi:hypothetical protein
MSVAYLIGMLSVVMINVVMLSVAASTNMPETGNGSSMLIQAWVKLERLCTINNTVDYNVSA